MFEYDQVAVAGDPVIPIGAPFDGERFESFREVARLGKLGGSLMLGQLNHPGRQIDCKIQPYPVSASDIQQEGEVLGFRAAKPRAASSRDLGRIIKGFAHSAEYLEEAGYDGIEIHAAHGYLLSQFLSPKTNRRLDQYGSTFKNRARLIAEIAEAVRKRTKPSFVMGIKLNSVDFQADGFGMEEAKQLCRVLETSSFDFVELSGGGLEHFAHTRESTKKREGFFMEFADLVTPELTKTKVFVTGGFKTVGAMVAAIDEIDGIGLARPLCQEPHLCRYFLDGTVCGALRQRPDESNYALTNIVAGSQIGRMAAGKEPLDMSKEGNEKAFKQAMDRWSEAKAKDSEMLTYGYADLANVVPI